MSIGAISTPADGPTTGSRLVPLTAAELYRMNVSEYERLVALGGLDDSRIELLDGLLVRKMGKNPPHVWSVDATEMGIARLLPAGWLLRRKSPVRIPVFDEPEPDIALVRGTRLDYKTRHPGPGDLGLLVEVAESSLDRDRGEKLQAYARARIPIYWIVNLIDRQIEVYTEPAESGYRAREDHSQGSQVPVILDGLDLGTLPVDELLP
jgi:Uma2 family endonuclease